MNKKTSLLNQDETIAILEEFLHAARRELVDVMMIKTSTGDLFKNTTEITFKMTEPLTLPSIEIVMKSHVTEDDVLKSVEELFSGECSE